MTALLKPLDGEQAHVREPQSKNNRKPQTNSRILRLQFFEEFTRTSVAKQWLIKGIMAKGETSAWIGPPGSLKSALLASATIAVSSGAPWFGRLNKGAAGVVYFALERSDLARRRIEAHRRRDGLDNLPIAICSDMINMMDPRTPAVVADAIARASDKFGLPVGLSVFDTFAKLISAGGGDEDRAKDQGAVFANLRRLREEGADCHCALVGHTGKDESRGSRGSNAIVGDNDIMVQLSGDGVRTATVIKANDAPEGPLFSFQSEMFDFGIDEDGDPISVNIVSDENVPLVTAAKSKQKLPSAAVICLRALSEAILECGVKPPATSQIPANQKVVPVKEWRRIAYSRGVSGSSEERAREQAFKRSMERLIAASAIGVWEDMAWPA